MLLESTYGKQKYLFPIILIISGLALINPYSANAATLRSLISDVNSDDNGKAVIKKDRETENFISGTFMWSGERSITRDLIFDLTGSYTITSATFIPGTWNIENFDFEGENDKGESFTGRLQLVGGSPPPNTQDTHNLRFTMDGTSVNYGVSVGESVHIPESSSTLGLLTLGVLGGGFIIIRRSK